VWWSRADDTAPQAVDRRLEVFHSKPVPLLDFSRERGILVVIDGACPG
jgi:adenylate kinase family enzyme